MYRIGERTTDVVIEYGGPWINNFGFEPPHLYENMLARRANFKGYPMKGVGVNVSSSSLDW